jgi:predicted nucleotidyltransferase component of viral defense system
MSPADWEDWVKSGGAPERLQMRQAVHLILIAVSECDSIKQSMFMKGGMLMAIAYDSSRYTRDIDFSTRSAFADGDDIKLRSEMEEALAVAVAESEYGIDCRVQSAVLKPKSETNPSFPTLKVKVAYAVSDNSKRHQRLIGGMSSDVVELDFSFNETTQTTTSLQVTDGSAIFRYSLADLVAEKYRSLLQQPIRKRNRRQDVYDIHWLLQKERVELDRRKPEIKSALEQSAKARSIHISKDAIRDPLVIKMGCSLSSMLHLMRWLHFMKGLAGSRLV